MSERTFEIMREIALSSDTSFDRIRYRQGYVQAMIDMQDIEFLEEN